MDVIKTLTMSSEEKANKKTEEIISRATIRAHSLYNIIRIDGVDYVTMRGIPVSLPEDGKSGSLCDRLDAYRKNYVDACVASGGVIGETS